MKKIVLMIFMASILLISCEIPAEYLPVDDVAVFNYSRSSDFENDGILNIDLLPLTDDDRGILTKDMNISAVARTGSGSYSLNVKFVEITEPVASGSPWAFAVDIDSSGSMGSNDRERNRVAAAKSFVSDILKIKPNSIFSIFDFGAGYTEGFSETRELTDDWTSDSTILNAAIDLVDESGDTPLYESINEILDSFNSEISDTEYERAMVVLSDGYPSSTSMEEEVYLKSRSYNIPINTVVLGSSSSNYYSTLQELADNTGGIFTLATDSNGLLSAFKSITLGNSEGYMTYQLILPHVEDLDIYGSITVDLEFIYKGNIVNKTIQY